MAHEFVVTAENNQEIFTDNAMKDGAKTYSFDFSPWAEQNHTVTTVTWTVKTGQVAITNKALTSNVATALCTFSESGSNLIQIKGATASNEIYVAYIDVYAKDPEVVINDDYGINNG